MEQYRNGAGERKLPSLVLDQNGCAVQNFKIKLFALQSIFTAKTYYRPHAPSFILNLERAFLCFNFATAPALQIVSQSRTRSSANPSRGK
jgi:hypothetical protein